MKLHNLMEEDVINTINKLMEETGGTCDCDKCKLDIAAVALNNSSPKYAVTKVTKAMEIVGKNPHHEL